MRRRHVGLQDALMALPGGKRKLLGRIFKHVPPAQEAPIWLEPFLGSAAVAQRAKALGHRVIANDVALRAVICGRALVENDRVNLTREDVLLLLSAPPSADGFIRTEFAGTVVPTRHAEFLDRALPYALRQPGHRGALLQFLMIRFTMQLRPHNNFGAKTIVRQMDDGAWESVNPSVLRDGFVERIEGHPFTLCEKLRRKINRAVFGNGHANRIEQRDALDFIADTEGDIAYLDPPYFGTSAYETAFKPLDSLLAGRGVDATPSRFSGRGGLVALDELIEACRRIPRLILSFGTAAVTPDEVERLVAKHRRDVRMELIKYAHLRALASAENREKHHEILITAGGAR